MDVKWSIKIIVLAAETHFRMTSSGAIKKRSCTSNFAYLTYYAADMCKVVCLVAFSDTKNSSHEGSGIKIRKYDYVEVILWLFESYFHNSSKM